MKISINSEIKKASDDKMALGVLYAKVEVAKRSEELWAAIEKEMSIISNEKGLTKASIKTVPSVAALQSTYKALGKNPNQFKGSNEALALRAIENKGFYQINTVVDANNLVSFESLRSVGSYDLSKLEGDIVFRAGAVGETYPGTTKRAVDLKNLPLLSDSHGPFGSPTSDSERALITAETKELLLVIYSFDGTENLNEQLAKAGDLLSTYANGKDMQKFIVLNEMELNLTPSMPSMFAAMSINNNAEPLNNNNNAEPQEKMGYSAKLS